MSKLTQTTLSHDSQFDKDDLAAAQAVVDGGGLEALQDPALYELDGDKIQLKALLPQNGSVRIGSNSKESEVLVADLSRNGVPLFISGAAAVVRRWVDEEDPLNGTRFTITGLNRHGPDDSKSFHVKTGGQIMPLQEGKGPFDLAEGSCVENLFKDTPLAQIFLHIPSILQGVEIDDRLCYQRKEDIKEISDIKKSADSLSQEYLSQCSQGSTPSTAVIEGVDTLRRKYNKKSNMNLTMDEFLYRVILKNGKVGDGGMGGDGDMGGDEGMDSVYSPPAEFPWLQGTANKDPVEVFVGWFNSLLNKLLEKSK